MVSIFGSDHTQRHALAHNLCISISAKPEDSQPTDSRRIQLPPKQETARFFQIYFEYIGYFQQIIYKPHAWKLIDEIYYQVAYISTTTAPPGLALIQSVIAISIILKPLRGDPH